MDWFCVTIWFSGEVLFPVGCPVVSPMAKFLIVKNEQDPVPVTPIVAGPGPKPALKERLAVVIEEHGGVGQYLNSRFKTAAHRRQLADQLIVFAPRRSNMTCLEVKGNPPYASVGCVHISELVILSKCSVRTWPQSNVCSDIFDDILAKNFQSISNPMVVTQCPVDLDEPPYYAFVKGLARSCTVVALAIFLMDAGLPPSALSAEFEMSASAIHSVYREFSSTTQIVLENAGASASRSIARMWDVLTWMGVLVKLKESGGITTDPAGIIKMYNEKSSSKTELSDGKRAAVMNLLEKLKPEAQMLLIEDVGAAGINNTPFTDDAWNNKKTVSWSCMAFSCTIMETTPKKITRNLHAVCSTRHSATA